jgi:polysaccharide pyruvyl transferase WcaK-like protein
MKKLALIGVSSLKNTGDRILAEVGEYLISKSIPDAYIIRVPNNATVTKTKFRSSEIFQKLLMQDFSKKPVIGAVKYRMEYFRYSWLMKKQILDGIDGVDGIILCGGGQLKYQLQGLNYSHEIIAKYAKEKNIPIFVWANGIEGFQESDFRCKRLIDLLNSGPYKIVTTRDDIKTLNERLIIKEDIRTSLVGDLAFWSPEAYGLEEKVRRLQEAGRKTTIGINLIRPNIFMHHNIDVSEDKVYIFFIELIHLIENEGWEWKLFSNGLPGDTKLAMRLLHDLNENPDEKILPITMSGYDFARQLLSFDAVLGTRMHTSIVSYALNIPTSGFIWNSKIALFSQLTKTEALFLQSEKFTAENAFVNIKKSMVTEYDNRIKNNLKNKTTEYLNLYRELLENA